MTQMGIEIIRPFMIPVKAFMILALLFLLLLFHESLIHDSDLNKPKNGCQLFFCLTGIFF